MADNHTITGLPPGAQLKPIAGLPAGAELRPIAGAADAGSQQEAPEQEGLLHSFASSMGILPSGPEPPLKERLKSAVVNATVGPIAPLYEGGKRSAGELKQGVQAIASGNGYAGLQHAITAIPVLGPTLDKGADQYADKNYMGEAGTLLGGAGQMAPALLGGVDAVAQGRPMFGQIPTRANAGKLFESVMKDAATQPVQMTRSMPILERAMQLSDAGHGTVTPLDKLYARINQTQPLEYAEARDRASALSTLTGEDKIKATKTLQSQTKQLSHAFNDDIGDAAASVGRGEDYAKAMQTYRQAAQLREGMKRVGQGVGIATAASALAPPVYRFVREAMK